jgi:hypothetical protein
VTLYQSGSNDIKYNTLYNLSYVGISMVGTDFRRMEPRDFPVDPEDRVDMFGNTNTFFGIQWEDLQSNADPDIWKNHNASSWSAALTNPVLKGYQAFQGVRNNTVEYNYAHDYLQKLEDGGAFYQWGTGTGQEMSFNLSYEENTHPNHFPVYSDDGTYNSLLRGNVYYGKSAKDPEGSTMRFKWYPSLWEANTKITSATFDSATDAQKAAYAALKAKIERGQALLGGVPQLAASDVPGSVDGDFERCPVVPSPSPSPTPEPTPEPNPKPSPGQTPNPGPTLDEPGATPPAAVSGTKRQEIVAKIKFGQENVVAGKGHTFTLRPAVYFTKGSARYSGAVTYASSNKRVAVVDKWGQVKALKPGKAKITATTKLADAKGTQLRASYTVKVVNKAKPKVTKVWISDVPKKLTKGTVVFVTAKYKMAAQGPVKVTYRTRKSGIVTVDRAGRLRAASKGTDTLVVKAGSKIAKYKIKVE